MKKIRWAVAAAAVGTLFLGACGGAATPGETKAPDNTNSTEATGPSDKSGTLNVWLMDGSQPQTVVDAVNKQFNEQYANVKVNVELQAWAGSRTS